MLAQPHIAPALADELLGDAHPLLEQLGSPGGLAGLAGFSDALEVRQIRTLADLRKFLRTYHARILEPLELPAIHRAFAHARQGELRELIAFDQTLASEPALADFASASRRVGQARLQRLRPLRDERLLQRYVAAVDNGAAHGWHTLVFGLTLAVYSLPLRQGLVGYAQQTTHGFIQAAARSLGLAKADAAALSDELCAQLPAAIEALLAQSLPV